MADFTMYDREREFKWQIECQLSGGTNAYIDAEDIYSGRLTRQISSGEGIEVGSCYVSELDLTIVASALPSNVVSVKPYFRLLTSTEIVEGVVRKYYTPYNLGVFKIASTKRKEYGRIDLVCYDKMADLDALIAPAAYTELLASDWKPFYLLDWIATKVDVTYTFTQAGIEAMPNGTLYFKLAEETSNIKTYRDLLQYVCMLIGAYGIFDEDGHLNIKTFADTTSYSLPASFRFSESFGDVPITYSGVELTVKNVTTMFGNANNTVVRLSDNPFLYTLSTLNQTTDYATFIMLFLRNIYTEFQGLSYYAGEFEIPPDASLNVGRLLAVTGGGASDTINCFLQKIDVNFDGRMMLSCGNPNTYVTRTQNRTTSSITNLTNRIETLESAQGGKEVYYGTTLPTADIGQDSSLYYKIIQRPEDLKTLNVVEYIQSARASYIPTDILVTNNTRIMMQGIFYQGDWVGSNRAFGINQNGSSYSRIVAGTSAGYNMKIAWLYFGNDTSSREIPSVHGTDAMVMVDVATRTLTVSGGGESHSVTIPSTVIFTPPNIPLGILCENISSEAGGFEIRPDWRFMNQDAIIKRFQVYYNNILAYDLIPVQNANDVTDCGLYDRIHRKYYPGVNYNNEVPFTAGTPTGEVINQLDECVEAGYLRVNDKWWEIYNGGTEYFAGNYIEITENNVITSTLKAGTNIQIAGDGTISASGAEIVQTVTSGTQLATINDKPIYAPTVSASQTQTSGTEIATINVGDTSTPIYAPTTTVTQTLTEGTEIGEVNGTKLYAPSGGGGGGGGANRSIDWDNKVDITLPYTATADGYFCFRIYQGKCQFTINGVNIISCAEFDNDVSGSEIYPISTGDVLKLDYGTAPGTMWFVPLKETGASGGGGEAIETAFIYSNEERIVGVWTDNKPLYQKTLNLTSPSQVFQGIDIADLTSLNIENLIKVEGFLYSATYGQTLPIYWSYAVNSSDIRSSNFGTVFFENPYLKQNISSTAYIQCPVTITIQYTKSTDAPGSAPYITSGAYAHHYSTTEQVIGTWIDGSTLYEKTYTYSFTASSNDYDHTIATLSSEINPQSIETNAFYRDGVLFKELIYPPGDIYCRYAISNNVLSIRAFNSSGSTFEGTVTIRYTKTS